MHTETDNQYMSLAIELAEKGRGSTSPNPMVGAVVVRDGKIVGKGYHCRFGSEHAEIIALQEAGENTRDATLYVTMEPCCHHGKTPPCTEAIIKSGISRVVAATIGEWVGASEGLGLYMLRSKNALKTDQVFAAVLITTILSIALFALVFLIERVSLPWARASRETDSWEESGIY